uniref:Uncharacterized protein n=1 Tax=Avena sativa TaxID=4498 RepID=A0ACD6AN21_AVESA
MHAYPASPPAGEMEVGDEESCSSLLLYCDEDPFVDDSSTPPPPQPPPPAAIPPSSGGRSSEGDHHHEQQQAADLNHLMSEHKARERCYAPDRPTGYLHRLLHDHLGVSGARSKAVRYIIYAFGRLGLAAATAFNAVNYLDRFLSIHCNLSWEVWMAELVSVACLSVACKLDEVTIPSLHDLQMEEVMRHSFRASAIRDVELALLKALQWRLACVTPQSYINLLPTTTAAATTAAASRLLLRSLSEPSFLRFDASVVAAAALRCVAVPQDHHVHLIISPLCQLGDDDAEECFKMMKALDTSSDGSSMNHKHTTTEQQLLQASPISVIPFEVADGVSTVNGRSAVSRRLFGTPTKHRADEDR